MINIVGALPIILNILGIVLLAVLIVLGIKMIRVMNSMEEVIKDVDCKVKSLNNIFHVVDKTTDVVAMFSDKIIDTLNNLILKIFKKKYNKKREEQEDE